MDNMRNGNLDDAILHYLIIWISLIVNSRPLESPEIVSLRRQFRGNGCLEWN